MERHEEMLSPEEQYAQLAPTLDTDGFSLYAAAEEITGLKVYEEFPYEDNRGMFEMADGHTLLRYLEAAYFGTVTWEVVPGTPYERAILGEVSKTTPEYADRVFTTAVVSYPELTHIGEDKDFTPVIEKALELGGYNEDKPFSGINGGGTVMTGFGHDAVLGVADQVIEAVKSGAIRHFFLVGGCDGARPGRNYYTEFVKQTPADTVVLTLACGKYRFNDLDLGTIGGLPRLMDVGQCNDAYGAVKIALALAEAFGCGVNDLPLSMVLSWYEQKAVCILLTLLYLGIKNIRLGPTLPAFVSPNVLNYLVENFGIAPITTPEEDLKQLLK